MKNNTKKILLALCLSSSLSAVSFAEEEAVSAFTANVTIASDYVWRGVTQTDNDPAIQGGFDYAHESGFAAGIWASNVDFNTAAFGFNTDASVEVDLYGSYGGEINDFGYEVGYIAYRYPNSAASNFEEIYVGGSYAGFDLTYYAGLDAAPEYIELNYGITVGGGH